MKVANLDNTGIIDIMVVEDPGVPVGMALVNPAVSCLAPNEVCKDVVWVPRKVS